MVKTTRYFANDSENGMIAEATPAIATDSSTSPIQGQRFEQSEFGRMTANDAIDYFQGLPSEMWTTIIDRRAADYVQPSYANHFHVNTSVGLGILQLVYEGMVGQASLIRANSDWQRIGLNNEGLKTEPHPYGAEVGQSWWDNLMAQAGGVTNRTPEGQADHLINAVNLECDRIIHLGDPQVGKWGIKGNQLIGRTSSPDVWLDSELNPVSDPYELVQWILRLRDRTAIREDDTDAPEGTVANALVVPTRVLQYFRRRQSFTPPSANSGVSVSYTSSIYDELVAAGIAYIGASHWMGRVSQKNGAGALLYRRDSGNTAHTQVYQPFTLERLPIFNNGHENVLRMWSAVYDLWFDVPHQTILIEDIV